MMNGRTNSNGTDGTIGIALKAPTDFSVAANTLDSLALTWTDPVDEYSQPSNVLVGEFKYTRIVRKLGSAPVNANDGEVVVESAVRNQYQSTPFVDANLSPNTYYYGAFSFTTEGTESPGAFAVYELKGYDAVLENNPWDVIAMACSRGDASSTWSVGDTKTATVNGINMTFEIIAFGENQSHLTLASDAGKKPGIVFGTKYAVGNIVAGKDGYPGQPPFTYIGSEYYNILNSYYNGVPADLKPYIQSCTYILRYLTGSYTEGESLPNVWESSQQQTAYLIPFDNNRANSFYPSASRRMKRHLSSSGAVISWILSDYEFAKTGGGNVPTLFNTFISTDGSVETPTGGPFTTAEECGIMFLFGFGISE